MYILGIGCYYHDSSATLLKDGRVVCAVEEERFTRIKHDNSFPINSIEYCLKKADITIDKIDYIAFYEKPLLKFERLIYQHMEYYPKSMKVFLGSIPSWINEKLRIVRTVKKKLKYKGDVLFVHHHTSHAASTFLPSPFKEAAILTADGVGEWTTTSLGVGKDNKITLLKHLIFPHSIGLLYSTITAYLGFSVNNSEYKVMGLAAFGDMNRKTNVFYKKLKEVIDLKSDGSFRLDQSYFTYSFSNRMPSKKLCSLLGGPITPKDSEMNSRHKDIAAAVQLITEDAMILMLNYLYKITKMKNLVLAGGVALNSVFNGKILAKTPFKNVWIQPNSSDGGTSMGAALYVYNSILNKKRNYRLDSAYLGPSFTAEEIKAYLEENQIKYNEFKDEDKMLKEVARLLHQDNIVGWFQEGMEWGPRALGARSILANPCNPNAQELINLKVKHREKFRPFAPVVCRDDAKKYFECDTPMPEPVEYMLMVYPIKKKWHKKIPSVTHVDGSGRLQVITKEQNKNYYNLIKEFGKISGVPILINTSFNIRGEPIVCTPNDAYRCMMGTEIDYLVMGKFLIKRKDNPKDIWNSEVNAKD